MQDGGIGENIPLFSIFSTIGLSHFESIDVSRSGILQRS